MACVQHNSFLLTSLPGDRRGRTAWLTLALSQLFFAYSAPNIAARPLKQMGTECHFWPWSSLFPAAHLQSRKVQVYQSPSTDRAGQAKCGTGGQPSSINLHRQPLTQDCPREGPHNLREHIYFIGRRRVSVGFFYYGISVRISWNFQSDGKGKLVPIVNYPPALEFTSEERLRFRCVYIVCIHFLSYQHSLFTVCVFVFLTLVAEQLQGSSFCVWISLFIAFCLVDLQ